MPIQVICAWCGKPMGTKEGETPHSITHGICPECAQKIQDELQQLKNQMEEGSKNGKDIPSGIQHLFLF